MVTKVEKRSKDESWLNPKTYYNGSSAATYLYTMVKVQRSSPSRRVEPEANAGRKIWLLNFTIKDEDMIYTGLVMRLLGIDRDYWSCVQ